MSTWWKLSLRFTTLCKITLYMKSWLAIEAITLLAMYHIILLSANTFFFFFSFNLHLEEIATSLGKASCWWSQRQITLSSFESLKLEGSKELTYYFSEARTSFNFVKIVGGNDPSVSLRHCIQVYVERSNLKIIGSGKDLIEKKWKL